MSSQTAGHSAGQTPAERIDQAIRSRGLTNLEAAFYMGVAEKTVIRWRKGDKAPRLKHAHRLAEFFGGDWSQYTTPSLEDAA